MGGGGGDKLTSLLVGYLGLKGEGKTKQKNNKERKCHRENTVKMMEQKKSRNGSPAMHWQFSYNVAGINGKISGPLCKKSSFFMEDLLTPS
jgi:hypothetical protein